MIHVLSSYENIRAIIVLLAVSYFKRFDAGFSLQSRIQYKGIPFGICGGKSYNWAGYSPNISVPVVLTVSHQPPLRCVLFSGSPSSLGVISELAVNLITE